MLQGGERRQTVAENRAEGVAKPHRLGGKLETSAYIWDLLHLPPAPALAASIPWASCSVQAVYTL